MVMEFSIEKKKRIACCIVDNHSLCQSNWAREISINITDFLIHRFKSFGFDIFIDKDEDKLLEKVSLDIFYTHTVVVSSGTYLGLSDRIFLAIEEICQQDFFISGHILERNENSYWKNGYYELHHQFYIVNMVEYLDLNKPFIGSQKSEEHIQIEPIRSNEKLYNDDEIAKWIISGTKEKKYEMKCHGWNIISVALKNNKILIDVGSKIRDNKYYLYYEYDHVFLKRLSKIYYNQFFCNNFYSSWNSDTFKKKIDYNGPVEQYVTVGIGLYWATNICNIGITDDTKVIFTDINYNCLQFMKLLVTEWDGKDYPEFYRKHMPVLPSSFDRDIDAYIDYTKREWEKFIEENDWTNIWNKVKKINFDFILIDYMSEYDFNWLLAGKNTIINLSDVFTHCPYIATQSLKYRISCENSLLLKLKNKDPNITLMMTSRASDGYYQSERKLFGKVEEFNLTDINQLTKLPWHIYDWASSKILG